LYLISTQGGEAVALTDLPRGAGAPAWSPDGRTIAFASTANEKDLKKWREKRAEKPAEEKKEKEKEGKEDEEERESDVRVITRAVYRFNGPGYLDPKRPQHIWIVNKPRNADEKVTPKQLTSGRFAEDNVTWAKDGSRIYFTSD